MLITPATLANILGYSYADLARIFYPSGKRPIYHVFTLPKKAGGVRIISKPSLSVRLVQQRFLLLLSSYFRPSHAAHAYVLGRSILTNAKQHVRKPVLVNIDLENFFGTITFIRVRGLFESPPFNFPKNTAILAAHICCYKNSLPQGAPTSPLISNMICRRIDRQIQQLALQCRARYTRYADDMTISASSNWLSPKIAFYNNEGEAEIGTDLLSIIKSNGFYVNEKKTRISRSGTRQVVTGLKVNERPNIERRRVKEMRLQLKCWSLLGYEAAEHNFLRLHYKKKRATNRDPSFKNVIHGRINYIGLIKGRGNPVYLNLANKYNHLVTPVGGRKLKIEVNVSSTDRLIQSSWFLWDTVDLPGAPDHEIGGSGVYINGAGLVTNAHVLGDKNLYADRFKAFRSGELAAVTFKVIEICQRQLKTDPLGR
ncbi:MAG: reverse transcriptase domain-containing protein [Aquisalimonadaceae bacterium]